MISNILAAFHCGFDMVKLCHLFQGHVHALPPVQFGLFVCPNQYIIALGFSFVVLNDRAKRTQLGNLLGWTYFLQMVKVFQWPS